MSENGHLNGSQDRGEKGHFWTPRKWNFPVFLILGSVEGGEVRKTSIKKGTQRSVHEVRHGTSSMGASFFGVEMSFLWYRGGLSLLFGIEISCFGIEILHSVVRHLDRLFLAST